MRRRLVPAAKLVTCATLTSLFIGFFAPVPNLAAAAEEDVYSPTMVERLSSIADSLEEMLGAMISPIGRVLGVTDPVSGDDNNTHEMGSLKHEEHMEIFSLFPHGEATHLPARSGNWFDVSTWQAGEIPTDGAQVVIPEGVTVTYNGTSDSRLKWVRIDGELAFAPRTDNRLIVDTMIVDPDGRLEIGTQSNPVTAQTDIIIANNGDIDVSWDTLLQSRGVIGHGELEIHGEEKLVHGKVETDPLAGDTSITMAETPRNWNVGDTIVIAGTYYGGYHWENASAEYTRGTQWHEPEDEVRTITAISGNSVSFAEPLVYDHATPRSDLKTSVANYSRTIEFRNEDGASTPNRQRGHFMIMHSDNADVRYAAFWHQGRTDKSTPSLEAVEFGSGITSGSNVRGRYSLHIHRVGFKDPQEPVMVVGNAVYGSPGWGYVHHDSNAIMHNNASYDTHGAGFVAETGNEIGTWTNNIAIFAKGNNWSEPKNGLMDFGTFDFGNTGDGFWFQGRLVKARNNVAASVNTGYVYFHRSPRITDTRPTGMLSISPEYFSLTEALYRGHENYGSGQAYIKAGPDAFPIRQFHDNEVFAANHGIHVTKANPNQGHDVYTELEKLTAWSVVEGAEITYTAHYILRDFDVVGRVGKRSFASDGKRGIRIGKNASDIIIDNPRIDNFEYGIDLHKGMTDDTFTPDRNGYVVIEPTITNAAIDDYDNYDAAYDTIISNRDISDDSFELAYDYYHPLGIPNENDQYGRNIELFGQKEDGIGTLPIPSGTDREVITGYNLYGVLAKEGYRTVGSSTYFVAERYYTDRANGDIHKVPLLVPIDPGVVRTLGVQWWQYKHSVDGGPINLASQPPETTGESVRVSISGSETINVLQNDTDPDGDSLHIDGFTQPEYGQAFQVSDTELLYKPDLDYRGTDKLRYWVNDSEGNTAPAILSFGVGVSAPSVERSPEPFPLWLPDGVSAPTADADGDGVADGIDNCANTANTNQADADGDGIGDVCDDTPGTEPPDADNDGVADESDNCPNVANATQSDSDRDGVGNACDITPNGAEDYEITWHGINNDITVDGDIQVYVAFDEFVTIDSVRFAIDGTTINTDTEAPYALGGDNGTDPNPYDTNQLINGEHTITATVVDGSTSGSETLNFTVDNTADPVDTDGDRVNDDIDNCPNVSNSNQNDFDEDGAGDACDTDDDNDGIADSEEARGCQLDPSLECGAPGDSDGDGVADDVDNCVNTSNTNQNDFDEDGAGDACDNDDDNDGIADTDEISGCQFDPDLSCGQIADADNDGVEDSADNCPNTANAEQTDNDGDGIGNVCDSTPNGPDNDGDGTADTFDNCPVIPNADQLDSDNDGTGDACEDAPIDTTNPTITLVSEDATNNDPITHVIVYETSEPTTATMALGTNRNNLNSTVDISSLTTTHTFTLEGLSNKSTYYYELTATDAAGNIATGTLESFKTIGKPQKVRNLSARSGSIILEWSILDTTIHDEVVIIRKEGGAPGRESDTPLVTLPEDTTEYTDETAEDGQMYTYTVFTVDEGTYSDPVTVRFTQTADEDAVATADEQAEADSDIEAESTDSASEARSSGSRYSSGGSSSGTRVSTTDTENDDTGANRAALIAQIERLTTLITQLKAQVAARSNQANNADARVVLNRALRLGMRGPDVQQLQRALNARGFLVSLTSDGSPGQETRYFGPGTLAALRTFQCTQMGICSGTPNTTGYGNVGPRTREELAQ